MLTGGGGNDSIWGGSGNDRLAGARHLPLVPSELVSEERTRRKCWARARGGSELVIGWSSGFAAALACRGLEAPLDMKRLGRDSPSAFDAMEREIVEVLNGIEFELVLSPSPEWATQSQRVESPEGVEHFSIEGDGPAANITLYSWHGNTRKLSSRNP